MKLRIVVVEGSNEPAHVFMGRQCSQKCALKKFDEPYCHGCIAEGRGHGGRIPYHAPYHIHYRQLSVGMANID